MEKIVVGANAKVVKQVILQAQQITEFGLKRGISRIGSGFVQDFLLAVLRRVGRSLNGQLISR
jgi:hypothetical protein